ATAYRSTHPDRTSSITSEKDGFPDVLDDVGGGRPRPPLAISFKPPTRTLHRDGSDTQDVELDCLPSIEFDVLYVGAGHVGQAAKGHDDLRDLLFEEIETPEREVVEMHVRNQNGIDLG